MNKNQAAHGSALKLHSQNHLHHLQRKPALAQS